MIAANYGGCGVSPMNRLYPFHKVFTFFANGRFAFGIPGLTDGLSFTVVAMGLFGFAEILSNLAQKAETANRDLLTKKIGHLYPTLEDLKHSALPIVRGSAQSAARRSRRACFFGGRNPSKQ